jgi:pSer/pThr/pTyr-binding forkhead associated (FHA) protein
MDANLVIFNRHGQKKEIPLKSGITVIGRRPDCDVRIPIMQVSRKHCRFVVKDDKTVIQDLGSTNGTFVNEDRVMEKEVQAGDVVAVGVVKFTLTIDGKPEKITPPEMHFPDEHTEDESGHYRAATHLKDEAENDSEEESLADIDPLP